MSEDNSAKSATTTDTSTVVLPIVGRIVAAGHDDALIELEGGDFAIGETVMLHAVAPRGKDGCARGICIAARRVALDHYYGGVGRRVWARRPPQ